MMSLQQINQMSDDAARRSKAKGTRPIEIGSYIAESPERLTEQLRRMPFIGDWVPSDLELVPRSDLTECIDVGPDRLDSMGCKAPFLFVDSSGLGADDEPALTFGEFRRLVKNNAQYRYAIVEAGQFQVVVGVYRKKTSKH